MTIPLQTRFEILQRDRFTCRFCGRPSPETELEVDHIFPRSKGGSDETSNLVTACRDCNRGKGDRIVNLNQSDWSSLEGKYFHILDSDGFVGYQGVIAGTVSPGVYMIETFDFLFGQHGAWRLATIAEMTSAERPWRFYTDDESMRDAYEHGGLKRPLPDREPMKVMILDCD